MLRAVLVPQHLPVQVLAYFQTPHSPALPMLSGWEFYSLPPSTDRIVKRKSRAAFRWPGRFNPDWTGGDIGLDYLATENAPSVFLNFGFLEP